MKFNEAYDSYKKQLEGLLNADNTDTITNLVKGLDEIKELYEAQEKEVGALKDKLVDVVKNTTFKTEPKPIDEPDKSMDEIMADQLNEIIAKRKG